jgi:hypothetical protein
MLLVIILLGTMTIMTTALVSIRQHSPIVAENASAALEAKVAAQSATDLTEAILQSEHTLTAEQLAAIITNLEESGVNVTVTATDLDGNAPSGEAQPLILSTSSTVGSQTYTLEKVADYNPDAGTPPDMSGFDWRFGEFALYGLESVELQGRAAVSKWPGAPEGKRLLVGTAHNGGGAITISDDATVEAGHLILPKDGNDNTVENTTGQEFDIEKLTDKLPVRPNVEPDISGLIVTGHDTYTYKYNHYNCDQSFRVGQLLLYDGTVLHVQGDRTIVLDRGLGIANATLRVEGNLTLIAHDIIMANDAAIEVADGGSLTIYVVDDIFLQDATIGFTREYLRTNPNYVDDPPDYEEAGPVRILTLDKSEADNLGLDHRDDDGGGYEIEIYFSGALRGQIHAPEHDVRVYDDAVLCGAAMGEHILVDDSGRVYHDPALAFKYGWTNPDSPIYRPDDPDKLVKDLPKAVEDDDLSEAIQLVVDAHPVAETPVIGPLPEVLERDADKCQAYGSPASAQHFEETAQ